MDPSKGCFADPCCWDIILQHSQNMFNPGTGKKPAYTSGLFLLLITKANQALVILILNVIVMRLPMINQHEKQQLVEDLCKELNIDNIAELKGIM